ncbi:kinase-like domain-containing protein [Thelonectria olida]|uniref:Kinase-like domain-containing protein n=1 Tax=Thelonectria olida TaxID=1576542 RepID=A0A9P8VTB1_9HYPO|nr:kinase-like domain-containing protein [Thelonectria olida]
MAALSGSRMMVAPHQQTLSPMHHQPQQLSLLDSADKSASSPPVQTNSTSSFLSASSPRGFSTDLTDSILEEGGESGSDSFVEPVTPVSRGSQDFTLQGQDLDNYRSYQAVSVASSSAPIPIPTPGGNQQSGPASPTKYGSYFSSSASSRRPSQTTESTTPRATETDVTSTGTPLSRRSTRGSTSSFKRTMSSFFRRTTSQVQMSRESAIADSTPSISGMSEPAPNGRRRTSNPRRFSMNRSSATTRSNSPPDSALEMAPNSRDKNTNGSAPGELGFTKKNRASTGLTLRSRAINFVGANGNRNKNMPPLRRRASSFDGSRPNTPVPAAASQDEATYPPERLPWALPPDSGTGAKARRMSLSLPDDFAVDVAELQTEFEYMSKFLGRHGKHLGKGAASKVTLMSRKGFPEELYAVKEFRGKSHRESQEEYQKKIKSEFSIAKSLHHPNIVETIRLCTDHGRWNHVMEYCSEGDLFSLVQKGHLKGEDRKKDRLCLFKQLIQGVNYLHANGIAHRDIKLENLLINKDSKLKITDFGVSEVFSGTHPGLRESGGQCGRNMGEARLCSPGICGSEPYIAPEVLAKKQAYDPRPLDVWSSAIIMIYLTFGGAIWSRAEPGNTHYDKLVKGWNNWYEKHPDPDACISDTDYPKCYAMDVGVSPPALRRLLLQMLNPDPQKRISIDGVINNRWLKNVECCQVESYDDPTQIIDATKRDATVFKNGAKKIFCHNHLPPKSHGAHSLGKMPGQAGY